ncbi:MAG: peptidase M28, partial [Verrucomicrobia bacterium]|nr:peptidase M28 [Verrucomicrobiota bacterium]
EVYSANIDGSDLIRLTDSPGYDAEASFSPDGKLIVFSSNRGAYPLEALSSEDRARFTRDQAFFADLYVMNADGSDVRQITRTPGYDGGPFFSPDGTRIVWRRFDPSGMNADIYTARIDGSDVQRVTDFSCMSWSPYYHPSQEYIIFTANKLGFENFELFLADSAGLREPVRVTYTPGFDGLPVFSPDGTKLSWTTNRGVDGKSNIHLAEWDHEAAQKKLQSSPLRGKTAAQDTATAGKISAAALQKQVEWLAAPERKGRRTGSPGAKATASWLSDFLKNNGVGAPGEKYLQEFAFPDGVEIQRERNHLTAIVGEKESPFTLDKDFRPLPFSDSGSLEAEVVFGGYGLSVPEGNGTHRYNSYDGLDVKDKVVLLLRYVPEGVEAPRRAQLNRYAGLRYKAMLARERGAKAVLVVSGPSSPQPGELLGLSSDNSLAGSGILAHSVSQAVAEALLAGTGKSLREIQSALDDENPHVPGGFLLPNVKVRLEAGIEHRKGLDHNVVAMIPPGPNSTGEWVLAGAHYDHLGVGAE